MEGVQSPGGQQEEEHRVVYHVQVEDPLSLSESVHKTEFTCLSLSTMRLV